jgi:hypothetical protein
MQSPHKNFVKHIAYIQCTHRIEEAIWASFIMGENINTMQTLVVVVAVVVL